MPKRESASLLETLLARLRKSRKQPEPVAIVRPFQGISIYRGVRCCSMAKRFSDHRFLAKDAPTLPLSGCSMPQSCECRYLKHKDRRGERRRIVDFVAAARSYMGQDRRFRNGRRKSDP